MLKQPIIKLKVLVQRGKERKWDITSGSETLTFLEKVSEAEIVITIKEAMAIIIDKLEQDVAYGDPVKLNDHTEDKHDMIDTQQQQILD